MQTSGATLAEDSLLITGQFAPTNSSVMLIHVH